LGKGGGIKEKVGEVAIEQGRSGFKKKKVGVDERETREGLRSGRKENIKHQEGRKAGR